MKIERKPTMTDKIKIFGEKETKTRRKQRTTITERQKEDKKESIEDRKKKGSKKRERERGIQGGQVVLRVRFSRFSPTLDQEVGGANSVGIGAYRDM